MTLDSLGGLYTLSGFLVGLVVGLTGVGGGSLMTPILIILFRVHPATAVGTDLLFAGLTKSVGTAVHGRYAGVSWRIVGLLACGSLPASIGTLLALRELGIRTEQTSTIISSLLGIALIVTAASLIFRRGAIFWRTANGQCQPERQAQLTILTGMAIGLLVSISSVGAGAIGIVALYSLYPNVPARTIVASDIAHAVPLTLVAGFSYWLLGSVDWTMLLFLLLGSVPGIVIGSLLARRMSERILRWILATALAVVGGRLLFA